MPCLPSGTADLPTNSVTQFMGISEADASAALAGFVEPYLRATLAAAGALRGVALRDGALQVRIELGFPPGGYAPELRAGAPPAPAAGRHRPAARARADQLDRRPCGAAQAASRCAGVRNIVAVACGKGGVGKSTVGGEPGAGLGRGGRAGRDPRCRHLRSEPAADARARRPAAEVRPTASASSRCTRTASSRCRSAS